MFVCQHKNKNTINFYNKKPIPMFPICLLSSSCNGVDKQHIYVATPCRCYFKHINRDGV